jgi:predicted dehydrogenase
MINTPQTTLSVGIVGCGYWGPNLVRNFHRLAGCKLSGICDRSEERLAHMESLYPEVPQFHDIDELLALDELDAVVIATPVFTHFELAKKALLAGKHTLIEKPMASTVAECDELNAIADEKGLTLMIGHTFLYSAPVRCIEDIIRRGDLGRVLYLNSQRLNLGLFQQDINVAWDLAPHDISIILHLLGKVPEIVNCQGNANITEGIEDVTNISLSFSDHQFAAIQSSWLEPRKVRQMTIVGSRRMIVFDDLQTHEKIRIYDTRVERPPHYDSFAQFHYSYHNGDCYIPQLRQEEPLKVLCEHFLECIAEGKRPLSCGHQGAKLVRILEATSESLAAGGTGIRLDGAPAPAANGKPVNGFAKRSVRNPLNGHAVSGVHAEGMKVAK